MEPGGHAGKALVVRVGARLCAIPLPCVDEIMRPLPVEPVFGAPRAVRGRAVVRGGSVLVVDLGRMLDGTALVKPGRFVTLRIADRRVALAVDRVLGIRALAEARLDALPPLLRDAADDVVAEVGTLDHQLLLVLRSARLIPDDDPEE